jgi:small subunit ribosomal protein S20
LANHKSALKRARQNEVRKLRNKVHKTKAKHAVKEVRAAIAGKSEQSGQSLVNAVSTLQKTVSKGVIHRNTAARKISRLTRQVSQLSAS